MHHTYEDYLQLEPGSPHKLEYCDGEIYAMAGGSPEHGALAMGGTHPGIMRVHLAGFQAVSLGSAVLPYMIIRDHR